jgi:hypothetical protein
MEDRLRTCKGAWTVAKPCFRSRALSADSGLSTVVGTGARNLPREREGARDGCVKPVRGIGGGSMGTGFLVGLRGRLGNRVDLRVEGAFRVWRDNAEDRGGRRRRDSSGTKGTLASVLRVS